MTGMLPITSGKVFIYGRDIEKDFDVLRRDIAFCKQENVLLDDLNVEEHLYLFSRLRVISSVRPVIFLFKEASTKHNTLSESIAEGSKE